MSAPIDALLEQIADAVARRVLEMQKAEAARNRTVYLTPEQMAERTGVTVKTLANLRAEGKGPKFLKQARRIRYPVTPGEAA